MSETLPVDAATGNTARAARSTRAGKTLPVNPRSVVWNPTPEQLRQFAQEMPNARATEFNNLNVATRVVSRSKLSTFVATDRPEEHSDQTITRAEYDRIAKLQDDYIRTRDMLVIEGFIGNDPEFRTVFQDDALMAELLAWRERNTPSREDVTP